MMDMKNVGINIWFAGMIVCALFGLFMIGTLTGTTQKLVGCDCWYPYDGGASDGGMYGCFFGYDCSGTILEGSSFDKSLSDDGAYVLEVMEDTKGEY